MKRFGFLTAILAVVVLLAASSTPVMAGGKGSTTNCTRIQDGTIIYSAGHYLEGQPLKVGYDIYGYNYQAHMFNGYYANVYLGGEGLPPYEGDTEAYLAANPEAENKWYWPYRDCELLMKWNDAWLGNKDCDGDGKLDRHFGYDSYIGSGAWETNHQKDSYIGDDGKEHQWEYFCKIVAVPADAVLVDNIWYTAEGTEMGPSIWGAFAIIQSVYNDPYGGYHGVEYVSPASAGFGFYKP